eukprot:1435807-Rhodomonas_salina.1
MLSGLTEADNPPHLPLPPLPPDSALLAPHSAFVSFFSPEAHLLQRVTCGRCRDHPRDTEQVTCGRCRDHPRDKEQASTRHRTSKRALSTFCTRNVGARVQSCGAWCASSSSALLFPRCSESSLLYPRSCLARRLRFLRFAASGPAHAAEERCVGLHGLSPSRRLRRS